ncbi:hypothetical protein U1Q18_020082 [Sarracenia purpurea var. burkii]
MWPEITVKQDSDQSLSEEEDLAPDWSENCVALGGTGERKGGIQIHSQLERQTDFSSEDEVEIPTFHDDGGFIISPRMASACNSEDEILSDDEKERNDAACDFDVKDNNVHSTLSITSGDQNFKKAGLCSPGREKQDVACTWSAVTKEAEALVHLVENARSSSLRAVTVNANKSCKGGRGKEKSKLLFRFQSHKKDSPWPVSSKVEINTSSKVLLLPQKVEAFDNRVMGNSMGGLLENVQGGNVEQSKIYGLLAEAESGHDYTEHSMAELLDSYQEKTELLSGNSKMKNLMKGKRVQLVDDRSIFPLGERNMDNDGPPEALDTGSSSGDKANIKNLGLIIPESLQKTMTDKFQEAFGAASINEERPHSGLHGIGIFGKLQRVMHGEKKRDIDFLRSLQIGATSKDEVNCIDVEILSRCLEAKLTVCSCSLSRDKESFELAKSIQMAKINPRRTLTVIFSSRVCDDVELEVGNLIRIHSPWKEVQVKGKDEVVVLSAYFSHILSL